MLINSSKKINGIKFFGSPFILERRKGFSFQRSEEDLEKIWKEVPDDVDVLVTHGPVFGIGDLSDCTYTGSISLGYHVYRRIFPKFHVFGHIHEGYGVREVNNIRAINCSICKGYNESGREQGLLNDPIFIEIDI